MKPDWDQLAERAHPSVFIADVNCQEQEGLCAEHHTGGQYPTILVYRNGNEELYTGGRGLEDLLEFVDKELAQRCVIKSIDDTCSAKEQKYIAKWKIRDANDQRKEIIRLSSMKDQMLTYELKKWLEERIRILEQFVATENSDEL